MCSCTGCRGSQRTRHGGQMTAQARPVQSACGTGAVSKQSRRAESAPSAAPLVATCSVSTGRRAAESARSARPPGPRCSKSRCAATAPLLGGSVAASPGPHARRWRSAAATRSPRARKVPEGTRLAVASGGTACSQSPACRTHARAQGTGKAGQCVVSLLLQRTYAWVVTNTRLGTAFGSPRECD